MANENRKNSIRCWTKLVNCVKVKWDVWKASQETRLAPVNHCLWYNWENYFTLHTYRWSSWNQGWTRTWNSSSHYTLCWNRFRGRLERIFVVNIKDDFPKMLENDHAGYNFELAFAKLISDSKPGIKYLGFLGTPQSVYATIIRSC